VGGILEVKVSFPMGFASLESGENDKFRLSGVLE
jgi:hypothetical protein